MHIAMSSLAFSMSSVMSAVAMALGFGLVIFVHELGHFMAAKMVGIRVERFAIGFGRKLIGFTWGETEYCINVLPLGGYVKMPGQEDFELQDEDNPADADPRAFNNRPIWARMIVVSAGVVMNVLLAALLFVIIFSIGREYTPSVVGDLREGYPAQQAQIEGLSEKGLRPGDVIEAINDRDVYSFDSLRVKAMLSDPDATFKLRIRRPGFEKPLTATVGVAPSLMPSGSIGHAFGISPTIDNVFSAGDDADEYFAAISGGVLKGGDKLISIDGHKIDAGWQLSPLEGHFDQQAINVVVEREVDGVKKEFSATITPLINWSNAVFRRETLEARQNDKLPPYEPDDFNIAGMMPRVMVSQVSPESPADRAGFKTGDVIAGFGPAYEPVSLTKMQKICADNAKNTVPVNVERDGKLTDEVTKVFVGEFQGAARIGIATAYESERAVIGSLAADFPESELKAGYAIVSVNGAEVTSWGDVINALSDLEDEGACVIGYRRPAVDEIFTTELAASAMKVDSGDYGYFSPLAMQPLMEIRKSANPWQAVKWGSEATGDFIIMTYATLKGFFTGRVSGREFSGPIGIFRVGISAGEKGIMWLLWLLAIISANLAVINFLPLPIVDGGLAVMLLIEKLRGKPLSVKVQNAIQLAGLAMIAVAFVLLTYNDIRQWLTSRW